MSTYADTDPTTDIILDFIAEHESAGNYNAVIGDARSTADLGRYTLNGIRYRLMPWLLIRRPRLNSTAVGRYQIIRKTLSGLIASKKLPGSARFTPELQDSLAVSLLIARGYSKWWTAQITNVEFAHRLSCEWASLPDPKNGGRSHYDGDGVNHAGTTVGHVYRTLARARAAMPGR